MKACTSFSLRGSELNYLRVSLHGSKVVIDSQGQQQIAPGESVENVLSKVILPDDLVSISFDSQNAITKHVVTPKARGQQAIKMAKFQLDAHLQGLEKGPYDCEPIALEKEKTQSNWLLTAQRREDLESQLKQFSNIPNSINGLSLKGLEELFKRVITPGTKRCVVLHCEEAYCTYFYYNKKTLGFVRRVFHTELNNVQNICDEIHRSCLLRDLDMPEVIYLSGPSQSKIGSDKLNSICGIECKELVLKNVETNNEFDARSDKLDLLGFAWLRLSESGIVNLYREEGEKAVELLDLQRRFCTPLILLLFLLGAVYINDRIELGQVNDKSKGLKTQAEKIFRTAMPSGSRARFSEKSYVRRIESQISKQNGNKNAIKLEEFMLKLQEALGTRVDFLMTNLNYQPAKDRHAIHGYVKNLSEFEKLNASLREMKGYSVTANFRKPGRGSSLGLRVSLTLEGKK
jgi:hypothetical protein